MACNSGDTAAADKVIQFESDMEKANSIINGDDVTDVTVDSGTCPTLRKTMKGITDAATGSLTLAEAAATTATEQAGLAREAADEAIAVTGVVPATEEAAGLIRVATIAESKAGTAVNLAVPPAHLLTIISENTTPTPTLTLPSTGNEGEEITGTYVIESGATPSWSLPVEITDFVDNGVGGFTFTGPAVTADTDFTISLSATKLSQWASKITSSTINIKEVEIQDGPTVTYANTVAAWPDATINDEIISTPAYSVGANNTNQIVSATPEITTNATEIPVGVGTTSTSLVTAVEVVEGDHVLTDQGDSLIGTVVVGGGDPLNLGVFTGTTADFSMVAGNLQRVASSGAAGTAILGPAHSDGFSYTFTMDPDGNADPTTTVGLFKTTSYGSFNPLNWTAGLLVPATNLTGFLKDDSAPSTINWFAETLTLGDLTDLKGKTVTMRRIAGSGVVDLIIEGNTIASHAYVGDIYFAVGMYYLTASVPSERLISVTLGEAEYTAVVDLLGVPTKAFIDPTVTKLNVDVTSTSTSLVSSDLLTEGETVILGGVGVPVETDLGVVTFLDNLYTANITAAGLSVAPLYASRRNTPLSLAIGETTDTFIEADYDKYPLSYTLSISGTDLKLTGTQYTFTDDPTLKQIALAVKEPTTMKFKDAKIYIQERL